MLANPHNEFLQWQKNYTLALEGDGANITADSGNAMGPWTDLFGALTSADSYGIYLWASQGDAAAASRPLLCDIGFDVDGATSYDTLIPQLLWESPAGLNSGWWIGGGVYYFPLFIPAGTRMAARAQTTTTIFTFRLRCILMQKPTHPELLHVGSQVEAVGADAASSRGTVFAPGASGAWGSWTSLGTLTNEGFYVVPGFGIDDSSSTNDLLGIDIATGDATNKVTLVSHMDCGQAAFPWSNFKPYPDAGFYHSLPAGAELFVRGAHTNTPQSNNNATCYVVRGN